MHIQWDTIDTPIQFDMITDTIAVGSLYSSYDSFQLIVNMAYRYDGDGFTKHNITHSLLSRLYNISFREALALAQQKRTIIQPNEGFMMMLETYIKNESPC
jgi:hypothetical protein